MTHPVHVGRQYFPHGKTAQESRAVICKKQHQNAKNSPLEIGCYSTKGGYLFLAKITPQDGPTIWRGMYAASKMMRVCEESMDIAALIAGDSPIDAQFEHQAEKYLSYDFTAISLREEAFRQVIPREDLKKINEALGLVGNKKPDARAQVFEPGNRSQIAFLAHLREMRNKADITITA